jgi:squalene-associated FAD-dependent desaturase
VAVVGGGWAGLAAAVTLVLRGLPVTVFEAARTLGGRARRVEVNGVALDNGLHILIGAYRETLDMIRLVSGDDGLERSFVRRPLELAMGSDFRLRAPRLPAPLHLAGALLSARGLDWRDRVSAANFMRAWKRTDFRLPEDESVGQLLARHRQSDRLRRFLWEPLCTAALNTPPEEASAQVFASVLRDSLNGARADSDLLLPRVDFSALFPEPAAQFIAARGGDIRLGCMVNRIARTENGFLVESDGTDQFDRVVCALPPFRVEQVAGTLAGFAPVTSAIAGLRYEPIWSVYLQYDQGTKLPFPMLGLTSGLGQWAFDRGALLGQHGLIGVVISASGPHEALDQQAVARQVHATLKTHVPGLGEPLWTQVIAEKRATFACTPALVRPPQRTPVPGLYLAGDYTASEYPATLEAAVRSGVACARMLLEQEVASPARS